MGFDHSGILVMDKPIGLTSAQVVARIKRLVSVSRVGHTGTLDPMASGVLVCCLNQATKLVPLLQATCKTYRFCLHLGIETDTQDATGTTVSLNGKWQRSPAEINRVLKGFKGTIEQRPPVYSALKHKGVALYRLARMGKPVQKPARSVRIDDIRVTATDLPLVFMEVTCSKGTYVRTLCADIGQKLGCGGHMKMLRRMVNGGFDLNQAVTLDALEAAATQGTIQSWVLRNLISMADALPELAEVRVEQSLQERILNGVALGTDHLPRTATVTAGSHLKITDGARNLIAIVTKKRAAGQLTYFKVFPPSGAVPSGGQPK